MPLYEFSCDACGLRFDASKRISERNDDEPCEKCHKPAKRVLTSFAVGGSASAPMTPQPYHGASGSCGSGGG